MISKCANPECSRPLLRLQGGRFFAFPTAKHHMEHFWLCRHCSPHFTLKQHSKEGNVELVPRKKRIA